MSGVKEMDMDLVFIEPASQYSLTSYIATHTADIQKGNFLHEVPASEPSHELLHFLGIISFAHTHTYLHSSPGDSSWPSDPFVSLSFLSGK